MKQIKKKLAMLLVSMMMIISISMIYTDNAMADDNISITVQVINKSWSKSDGAPWEGQKLNKKVTIASPACAIDAFAAAVPADQYTISGTSYGSYITEIYGISEFDAGATSGWMYTKNGNSANSIDAETVLDGDKLVFGYVADYTVPELDNISISGASMTPSFNKNTKSYKLLISTSSKQITINPETVNTMFGTEIIYNGTTVSDTTINVSAGDTIVVKMTDPWGMATDTLPEYTYTVAKSSSSSGGSSSGGSSSGTRSISTSTAQPSGTWKRDDIGWWYQYSDGTYPTSGWRTLAWNGQYKWYHFDKIGYMDTGWFTDIDGHRYFLYPVSDGEQGKMLTGWQRIEGLWYYFYETSGSPLGSLAINTTIGGYKVDSNGAWLQ